MSKSVSFSNRLFTARRKALSNYLERNQTFSQPQSCISAYKVSHGASLTELAIALPVLVVFATLTYQVWGAIEVHKALDNTAREAARYASLRLPPTAHIIPSVQEYVTDTLVPDSILNVYDPSKISVNVERLGTSPASAEDAAPKGALNPGDILRVSVSLAANQPGGFYSYLIGSGRTSIVRSATYVSGEENEI